MAFREVNREMVAILNIVMNGTVSTWGIIIKSIVASFSLFAVVVSWPVGDRVPLTVFCNRRSQQSYLNRGL